MLLFIVGLSASLIYSYAILPKNMGEFPVIQPTIYPVIYKGMLVVIYSKTKAIHLHHWILYLFLCIVNIIVKGPDIITGFASGLTIQGYTYSDSCKFICNNPY